jgi:hypothetical protein
MRLMPVAIVVAGLMGGFGAQPAAAAREGPWCATIWFSQGEVFSDCSYATFAQCLPEIRGGNRGLCTINPRWRGPIEPARRPVRHRRAR